MRRILRHYVSKEVDSPRNLIRVQILSPQLNERGRSEQSDRPRCLIVTSNYRRGVTAPVLVRPPIGVRLAGAVPAVPPELPGPAPWNVPAFMKNPP
jgi:hypothetical protein